MKDGGGSAVSYAWFVWKKGYHDDAAKYAYNIKYNFLLHKFECLICCKDN